MRKRTKITVGITGGVLAVALAGVGTLMMLNRPLSSKELDQAIETQLSSAVENEPTLSSALLTVYSGATDTVRQYAVGSTHTDSGVAAQVDSTYHSASVGKTMLATVYGQLVDDGTVSFDDPIANWLDDETLEGLFVVDGIDHAETVTIAQLLSHTSGVADYFEGPVTSGKPILTMIADNPDLSFAPEELLDFSREHQQPVGTPGAQFSYSDTGYVLLGLALEQIEQKTYAQILDDRIFSPLDMSDSYLMTEFGSSRDILSITLNGIDLSDRNALSIDWAGGGVVTTMNDLLTFSRALFGGELLNEASLAAMTDFAYEMEPGLHYGQGVMQFRFAELSPLLFSMSDLHGAVGATGSFALYDPSNENIYIANFGSLDYQQKAIEQLVEIRLLVDRLQE